jgi:hypothetical protein
MFAVVYPAFWLNKMKRRNKRSPLTSDLLRSPGELLRTQIDELNSELDFSLLVTTVTPLSMYAYWLSQIHFSAVKNPQLMAGLLAILTVAIILYQAVKIYKLMGRRNDLRLGLDCELAVGQELNQLMLDGCRVYHDFQADGFNIDHIVIGANGIFAIETKGRAKPDRGRGQEDVRVVYEGQSLQFPTWKETEPIEQAKRQAVWLTNWLTKAVGEQVTVKPALALPGWYVERKSKDMLVFSGKNPRFIATIRTVTQLSPEMIQRVAFQVEQQCRDVEPQSYRKQ